MSYTLFSNIFSETHAELDTLQQELNQLQIVYLNDNEVDVDLSQQSNETINEISNETTDNKLANETIDNKLADEITDEITDEIINETTFTSEQIKKFQQIYLCITIENIEEHNKNQNIKKDLDKIDEVAQRQKLIISECC